MRWTREDCSPVRFATRTVDCKTRPLKKRAKWRPQPATRKLLRRVWSSPHFPSRSAPAAAELAVAAVDLGAEQGGPEAPAGLVAAEARAALEVRAEQAVVEVRAGPVEREAVAEPEAPEGLVAAEARELRAVGVVQGQQRGSIIRTIR